MNLDEMHSPLKLLNAIASYRAMDLRRASITELEEILDPILSGAFMWLHVANIGGPVFRIRKIENNEEHLVRSDVWMPKPAQVRKMGRINPAGTSVFYGALDPLTAIREARVLKDERFSLSVYRLHSREKWDMTTVRLCPNPPSTLVAKVPVGQRLSAMILYDFLFTEFSRPVEAGTEFQYKVSCLAADHLMGKGRSDSILYPSTQDSRRWNIAVLPTAATERLQLHSVLTCRLERDPQDDQPQVRCEAHGIQSAGSEALNYTPGSPVLPRNAWVGDHAINVLLSGGDPADYIQRTMDDATERAPYALRPDPSTTPD